MQRQRDEREYEDDDDDGASEAKRGRGAPKKRFEKGACPPQSVYQFFHIVAENERGYDYRCVLSHASPLEAVVTKCVGPTNLLSHMKTVHGFVMAKEGPGTKDEKKAFFARAGPRTPVTKDKATSLLLHMIIRDLRPFSIADGAGFEYMLQGFGVEAPSAFAISSSLDKLYVSRVLKLKALLASPKNVL